MTIKQVFVEDGVDRPHPPKRVIDAFKAGFAAALDVYMGIPPAEIDEQEAISRFYEWWEGYAS